MAAYATINELKTAITESIYQNNAGLVTAEVLQERLIDIIDTLESLHATDQEIQDAIDALVDSAPGALNTLNELAAALGDDSNYATTVTNALATKAALNATILPKTTTYQVAGSDNNKIIECSGTFTVTFPNSLDTGFQCVIVNVGTGVITLAAATTFQSKNGNTKLASQYGAASVYHRGSNVFLAFGDLSE
jgi:hypothetical protein